MLKFFRRRRQKKLESAFARALDRLREQDWAEAASLLEECVNLDPRDEPTLANLLIAQARLEDWEGADRTRARIDRLRVQSDDIRVAQAIAAIAQQQSSRAEGYLRPILLRAPGHVPALVLAAEAASIEGIPEKVLGATKNAKKYASIDEHPLLWRWSAEARAGLGDPEGALQDYRQIIESRGKHPPVVGADPVDVAYKESILLLYLLHRRTREQGYLEEAACLLKEYWHQTEDPEAAEILLDLCLQIGKPSDAAHLLRLIRAERGVTPYLRVVACFLQGLSGQPEQALGALKLVDHEALGHDEKRFLLEVQLMLLLQSADYPGVIALRESVPTVNSARILNSYAVALHLSGDPPSAMDAWKMASKLFDDPISRCNIASIKFEQGQEEEALSTVRVCLQQAPRNPGVWSCLFGLLLESGRTEEAEQLQSRMPETLGDDPLLTAHATQMMSHHMWGAVRRGASSPMPKKKKDVSMTLDRHEQPLIGIVTALPKEFSAVRLMLESPREIRLSGKGAGRRILLGEVPSDHGGTHTVAVAMLPDMGNNSAAMSTTKLLDALPSIRHVIMCGIAGGIPNQEDPEHDVRLGDIVVSDRNGVVQYDLSKERPDGTKEHRHPPRPPSSELLEAVAHLTAGEQRRLRPWEAYLGRGSGLIDGIRPLDAVDAKGEPIDYPADPRRTEGVPRVFHGTIAAANILLKNREHRDKLGETFGVKAVEMESSGVADATWYSDRAGYLVIRGICDYCDGSKGDVWQGAASVAAAAYVRSLLESMHVESNVNPQ